MGIYKATAISRLVEKSIDELTFCKIRGRNVVKTKIDRNTSKTLLQQKQRARWTELQELDALFDEAVLVGFPSRPHYLTAHNAFVKANAKAVDVSEDLKVTTDYKNIVCSKGKLKKPQVSVSANEEQNKLTFTHVPEGNGTRRMATDKLYAMVVEKALQEAKLFPLDTRADKEPMVVDIPVSWTIENLNIYVFVLSANGHKASNTETIDIR